MAGVHEVDYPHIGFAGVLAVQSPGARLQRPLPRHRYREDRAQVAYPVVATG